MKAIKFEMPPILIDKLGLTEFEPFMHNYLITENGDVMVPWYDFIDPQGPDEVIGCAIHEDIEYFDAYDLMEHGLEEYRHTLKDMLRIMIQFHNDKFDKGQKGEA